MRAMFRSSPREESWRGSQDVPIFSPKLLMGRPIRVEPETMRQEIRGARTNPGHHKMRLPGTGERETKRRELEATLQGNRITMGGGSDFGEAPEKTVSCSEDRKKWRGKDVGPGSCSHGPSFSGPDLPYKRWKLRGRQRSRQKAERPGAMAQNPRAKSKALGGRTTHRT